MRSNAGKNITVYVFDEQADWQKAIKYFKGHYVNNILLCPVTTDQVSINKVSEKLKEIATFGEEAHDVNILSAFDKKAYAIKDHFVEFVHDFANTKISGGKSIKEYFKFPFKDISTWWFSLVVEKSVLKSNAFDNMVKLLAILDRIDSCGVKEIYIDLKNRDLVAALIKNIKDDNKIINFSKKRAYSESYCFAKNVFFAINYIIQGFKRFYYLKKNMGGFLSRLDHFRESQYVFVTYFPLLDKARFREGEFINRYYEPLQRALKGKDRHIYNWLAINSCIDGYTWKEGVKIGSQINSMGETLLFYEEWLGIKQLLMGFMVYLRMAFLFILKRHQISKSFIFKDKDNERFVDLWQIYKNEWYSSFCGDVMADGILFYLAFQNILARLKKGATILYYMENHGWEKALNIAANEVGGLNVVGVQHSSVPALSLNFFECHIKNKNNDENINGLPSPNYLACVGKTTQNIFEKQGWDKQKLFILGGLRYKYISKYLNGAFEWDKRENMIIVALTISPIESQELLYYVYQAFGRIPGDIQIVIKAHYASQSIATIMKSVNLSLDKQNYVISDVPMSTLLPKAKALVTCGSTVDIEALACRCPVIIPRLASAVDNSPLSNFTDLAIYVDSPNELKNKIDKIIRLNKSPLSSEDCVRFVKDYFEPISSDEEYLNRLEFALAKNGGKYE